MSTAMVIPPPPPSSHRDIVAASVDTVAGSGGHHHGVSSPNHRRPHQQHRRSGSYSSHRSLRDGVGGVISTSDSSFLSLPSRTDEDDGRQNNHHDPNYSMSTDTVPSVKTASRDTSSSGRTVDLDNTRCQTVNTHNSILDSSRDEETDDDGCASDSNIFMMDGWDEDDDQWNNKTSGTKLSLMNDDSMMRLFDGDEDWQQQQQQQQQHERHFLPPPPASPVKRSASVSSGTAHHRPAPVSPVSFAGSRSELVVSTSPISATGTTASHSSGKHKPKKTKTNTKKTDNNNSKGKTKNNSTSTKGSTTSTLSSTVLQAMSLDSFVDSLCTSTVCIPSPPTTKATRSYDGKRMDNSLASSSSSSSRHNTSCTNLPTPVLTCDTYTATWRAGGTSSSTSHRRTFSSSSCYHTDLVHVDIWQLLGCAGSPGEVEVDEIWGLKTPNIFGGGGAGGPSDGTAHHYGMGGKGPFRASIRRRLKRIHALRGLEARISGASRHGVTLTTATFGDPGHRMYQHHNRCKSDLSLGPFILSRYGSNINSSNKNNHNRRSSFGDGGPAAGGGTTMAMTMKQPYTLDKAYSMLDDPLADFIGRGIEPIHPIEQDGYDSDPELNCSMNRDAVVRASAPLNSSHNQEELEQYDAMQPPPKSSSMISPYSPSSTFVATLPPRSPNHPPATVMQQHGPTEIMMEHSEMRRSVQVREKKRSHDVVSCFTRHHPFQQHPCLCSYHVCPVLVLSSCEMLITTTMMISLYRKP